MVVLVRPLVGRVLVHNVHVLGRGLEEIQGDSKGLNLAGSGVGADAGELKRDLRIIYCYHIVANLKARDVVEVET